MIYKKEEKSYKMKRSSIEILIVLGDYQPVIYETDTSSTRVNQI